MITYYVVRHGTKEAIPFDPPLTPVGMKQAELTAQRLKDVEFKEVLVSPKLRTRQTAEVIAKPHSLSLSIDDRLIERLEWEKDETFDDFFSRWQKTDIDRSQQPKNGMSSLANGKRMRTILEEAANRYTEGNILIVTHGGTIGDLLRNLFTEEAIEHMTDSVSGARYINILECSVTIIQKKSDTYELLKVGDVSHLSIPLT